MRNIKYMLISLLMLSLNIGAKNDQRVQNFNQNWRFTLADSTLNASAPGFNDNTWRSLNLPHDWSIESDFGKDFPASPGGGALPGGLGWYRKNFTVDKANSGKRIYIDFDGVYRNSEVWINGTSVGKRPYGYISFRYDLTPYIKFGENNVIAVKVDNSKQPNSRWYSGSGIFRNVWLVTLNPVHVDHWGTYVTTPEINADSAQVTIQTTVKNDANKLRTVRVEQLLYDAQGILVGKADGSFYVNAGTSHQYTQRIIVKKPVLWNIENPYMYKLVTRTHALARLTDEYVTPVGIRSFVFNVKKGFILNGKHIKINGVCNHHDLGAWGAAVNTRAIERQLEILKEMGCNGIRTSHNPPAPELLDLCDRLGFIV
ncbi:MAG: glycoside hydrolase family 2 TIM barrel-domain containing protein, partial [Bacteroidota bacterium]|nr:glycoside hydrolase family 2 TIM barrel-domain containing protein [Bacteroidota bacterium]